MFALNESHVRYHGSIRRPSTVHENRVGNHLWYLDIRSCAHGREGQSRSNDSRSMLFRDNETTLDLGKGHNSFKDQDEESVEMLPISAVSTMTTAGLTDTEKH
jgi:hypothetical protein